MALRHLHDLIAAHVLATERLHGDDTPVPVLVKGKTDIHRTLAFIICAAPCQLITRTSYVLPSTDALIPEACPPLLPRPI